MIWKKVIVFSAMLVFQQSLAWTESNVTRTDANNLEAAGPFQLTVSPAQVNRFSTDNLTLRCSRNTSVQTNMVQIFRMRILKKSEAGWTIVADQRDKIKTAVEGNLTASAKIDGPVSNVFLQVTWDKIGDNSFGFYRCDVMGFDTQSNTVMESTYDVDVHESHAPDGFFVDLTKQTEEKILDLKEITEDKIVFLKDEVTNVKKSVDTFESEQSIFHNDVSALQSKQSDVQNRIAALEWKQSDLQMDVATLKSKQSDVQNDVAMLQSKKSDFQNDVATLQSKQSNFQNDVATLQSKQSDVQNDVAVLQSKQSDVQNDVATLQSKQSDVQNDVAVLQSKQSDVQNDVATLQSKQSDVQNDVATLQSKQSDVQNDVAVLQSKQSDVQNDVAVLQSKQSSCQNSISALRAQLSSLQNKYDALKSREYSSQQHLNTLGSFKDSLTQWPEGHYALLQPKTGCPVDLAFFSGTHRYQKIHTESDDNEDSHSAVFLPTTKFFIGDQRFFTIELCESHGRFNSGRSWPRGSYCIHKLRHKSCPWPFIDGNVFFDTEDGYKSNEGRNNVAHSDQNLRLYFCCQNSGSARTPIQLPTETPFILYRKGGTCQAVKGMSASYHYFFVDTEDDNNQDDTHGTIPDVDRPGGRNFRFHLCYYSPL